MQHLTVKSIERKQPRDPSKSPFYVVTDDKGAQFTSFDSNVATLSDGAVIEAEIRVDGKHTNIQKWALITPGRPAIDTIFAAPEPDRQHITARECAAHVAAAMNPMGLDAWEEMADYVFAWITESKAPPQRTEPQSSEEMFNELGRERNGADLESLMKGACYTKETVVSLLNSWYKTGEHSFDALISLMSPEQMTRLKNHLKERTIRK